MFVFIFFTISTLLWDIVRLSSSLLHLLFTFFFSFEDEKSEGKQISRKLSQKQINAKRGELVRRGIDTDSAAALPKRDDDAEEEDQFFYTKGIFKKIPFQFQFNIKISLLAFFIRLDVHT